MHVERAHTSQTKLTWRCKEGGRTVVETAELVKLCAIWALDGEAEKRTPACCTKAVWQEEVGELEERQLIVPQEGTLGAVQPGDGEGRDGAATSTICKINQGPPMQGTMEAGGKEKRSWQCEESVQGAKGKESVSRAGSGLTWVLVGSSAQTK